MRRLASILLLLAACALTGQEKSTVTHVARISFERRWAEQDPQWFALELMADGSAKYRSLARQDEGQAESAGEPFELEFTLSPGSRRIVFDAGPRLADFKGSLDRAKVASTGTKTLRYEDGAGNTSAITYNYSSARELTAVTDLMVGISQTIELWQTLQFQTRFDKLGLDSTLRRMEEMVPERRLAEMQLLEPVLTRIANDASVLNIARQRARDILKAVPNSGRR